MARSIIQEKTYAFASRMVKVYKYLTQEQREFVLSKQALRSGTSIGANVEEALAAGSTADFVHKLTICARNQLLAAPVARQLFPSRCRLYLAAPGESGNH